MTTGAALGDTAAFRLPLGSLPPALSWKAPPGRLNSCGWSEAGGTGCPKATRGISSVMHMAASCNSLNSTAGPAAPTGKNENGNVHFFATTSKHNQRKSKTEKDEKMMSEVQ